MSPQLTGPIRSIMQALAQGLIPIIGPRFLALYLGGSASMGDFCEASSDLDFMVVTDGPLSPEELLGIGMLHHELLERYPYAARLEGDYAPVHFLISEGTSGPVPGCERGIFLPRVGEVVLAAHHICNLRHDGIAFYGPSPDRLLPPVTSSQVLKSVRQVLMEGLGACETAQEAAAAFLNLLRSAVAIQAGRPATKSEGAAWGLARFDQTWHDAIRAAVAIRVGSSSPRDEALVRERLPQLERLIRTRFAAPTLA